MTARQVGDSVFAAVLAIGGLALFLLGIGAIMALIGCCGAE